MKRFSASFLVIVFSLLMYLLAANSAQAATYYVSGTGNDNNSGTQAAPWRTIQKAANTMVSGDTANILAGTYTGNVNITRSGTSSSKIEYAGTSNAFLVGIVEINASNIIFRDMDVRGNIWIEGSSNIIEDNYVHDSSDDDGISTSASPRDGTQSVGNIIRNNRIERVVKAGLYIEGRDHVIEGNDISRTQDHPPDNSYTTDADGIRFFGAGHVFRRNYVHDIYQSDMRGAPHIDTMQTWENVYNVRFEENIFHNPNPTGSNRILMLENQLSPVRDITWVNNIFIFSDDSSSFLNLNRKSGQDTISNMVVVNNTFYSPNGPRDKAASFQNITNATFRNNNLINATDGSDYVEVSGGATATVSNNSIYNTTGGLSGSGYPGDIWMQNPQVVSISAMDFHLTSSSPLVNSGISHTYSNRDYDGNSRPQGTAYDIGAYEFVTGGPTNPPSTTTPTPVVQPTATSAPTQTPTSRPATPTPTTAPTVQPTTSPVASPVACRNSTTNWQSNAFTTANGILEVNLTAIPSANAIDGVFALSQNQPSSYDHLAVIARFAPTGVIDAINGTSFYQAVNSLTYAANTHYNLRFVVNIPAKTYSLYVTPLGGSEVTIAENYAFRSTQSTASSLSYEVAQHTGTTGNLSVCNLVFSSASSTATPTSSPSTPGDSNGDGNVDGLDYVTWLNYYGQQRSGAQFGDFNNSGAVDGLDYVIWLNNYSG